MYIQGEGVGELQYSTKQLTKNFDFSSFFDCVLQIENPFKNQTFFFCFFFFNFLLCLWKFNILSPPPDEACSKLLLKQSPNLTV